MYLHSLLDEMKVRNMELGLAVGKHIDFSLYLQL